MFYWGLFCDGILTLRRYHLAMAKSYQAYLLRMWHIEDNDQAAWRATLEDPATRQVLGFNSLESLCEYLVKTKDEQEKRATPENPKGLKDL